VYLHCRYHEVPMMKTRVQKWGNSLALRIPKAVAADAGLRANTPVELSFTGGKLIIRPIAAAPPTLEELLRGVTKDNLHGEWDTGPAAGREAW
jgi:antitoxin MazE